MNFLPVKVGNIFEWNIRLCNDFCWFLWCLWRNSGNRQSDLLLLVDTVWTINSQTSRKPTAHIKIWTNQERELQECLTNENPTNSNRTNQKGATCFILAPTHITEWAAEGLKLREFRASPILKNMYLLEDGFGDALKKPLTRTDALM